MPKYIMALDSGTTSNRCILFNAAGEVYRPLDISITKNVAAARTMSVMLIISIECFFIDCYSCFGDYIAPGLIDAHRYAVVIYVYKSATCLYGMTHTFCFVFYFAFLQSRYQ